MYLVKLFFIFILSFGLESVENLSDLKKLDPHEYEEFLDSIENSDAGERFTYGESGYFDVDLIQEGSFKPKFTKFNYDAESGEYSDVEVSLTNEQLSQVIAGFTTHADSILDDFEVSGENVTSLGNVEVEVIVYLMDKDLAGIKYRLFQPGAYHEEETYGPHFDDEIEAIRAGWDTGADVSWSNHFILDHNNDFLTNSYWEWTGW